MTTAEDFRKASASNGFYRGPPLTGENIREIDLYLGSRAIVRVLEKSNDYSVRLQVAFFEGPEKQKQTLATEVAFIRNPEDWHGYNHHIILSTQDGCSHNCGFCVDGLPASLRGHLNAAQMAFAVRRALATANLFKNISDDATIKVLQLGSGDPLANHFNNPEFIRNVHRIDPRIKYLYLSTAGATGALIVSPQKPSAFLDAVKIANDNGIKCGLQGSVHSFVEEERKDLISNPVTQVTRETGTHKHPTIIEALQTFSSRGNGEVDNESYVNYSVIPGWNDTPRHARLAAAQIPQSCILKVVALNDVKGNHGKFDDKGNMFVLNINSALEGVRINLDDPQLYDRDGKIWAKNTALNPTEDGRWASIKQYSIQKFLQVACTRSHVLEFAALVKSLNPNLRVITPEDKAFVVGAQCGHVGDSAIHGLAAAAPGFVPASSLDHARF